MKAIVELALEGPLKLRVIEIAGMQFEVVRVNRYLRVLEIDDYFYAVAIGPRIESQQRMLIEAKLLKNALQAGVGIGHDEDCIWSGAVVTGPARCGRYVLAVKLLIQRTMGAKASATDLFVAQGLDWI